MKVKKCLLIFLSFLLILSFTGCKKDDKEPVDEVDTNVNVDQNIKDTKDEEDKTKDKSNNEQIKDNTETSNLGKRSNPVPFGQWVEFKDTYHESYDSDNEIEGQFRVRIIDIVRGEEALEQLELESSSNEPAPEGNEWVIVNFELEMLEGEYDSPYNVYSQLKVISSSGSEVQQDDYAYLKSNKFGYVDLFPGGSHSGREAVYVPEGDNSLLAYQATFNSTIYFSLEEGELLEEVNAGEKQDPPGPNHIGEPGKRSNPIQIGEWAEFTDSYYESVESMNELEGNFKVRITDVVRGDAAMEQLELENSYNEPAPEGNEWIVVTLEFEMLDGDEDYPYTVSPYLKIVSSSGTEIPQDEYAHLYSNEFGYVDLFPGGTHSGREALYVPVGDESLLGFSASYTNDIFFSITE